MERRLASSGLLKPRLTSMSLRGLGRPHLCPGTEEQAHRCGLPATASPQCLRPQCHDGAWRAREGLPRARRRCGRLVLADPLSYTTEMQISGPHLLSPTERHTEDKGTPGLAGEKRVEHSWLSRFFLEREAVDV